MRTARSAVVRVLVGAAICSVLVASAPCAERPVTLEWEANPKEEQVVGYRVYFSPTPRIDPAFSGYHPLGEIEHTTSDVLGTTDLVRFTVPLPDAERAFCLVVTAYNAFDLESDYSAEVTAEAPGPGGGGGGGGGGPCFVRAAGAGGSGYSGVPPILAVFLIGLAIGGARRRRRPSSAPLDAAAD